MKWSIFGLVTLLTSSALAQMVGVAQGEVLDAQGNPIPEVTLKFTYPEDEPDFEKVIVTKPNGSFTLAGLKPYVISIYATKEGYRDQILNYKQGIGKESVSLTMLTLEEAYQEMKEKGLIKEDPKEVAKEFYNLAVPLFKQEKYAESLEALEQSLEKDPELTHALKLAAYCTYNTQQWEAALGYADRFLALKPNDAKMLDFQKEVSNKAKGFDTVALYGDAVNAINANDDATAAQICQNILKLDPDFAMAHYQLGYIHVREFDFDKAVAHLKRYLELAPDHEKAAEVRDLVKTLEE